MHYAAWEHSPGVAKVLIDNGANKEAEDQDGATPLRYAFRNMLRKNREEIVKLLIGAGAKVHMLEKDDTTLLHKVAEKNRVGIAKQLIEAGVDKDARNQNGETPLHYAACENSSKRGSVFIFPFKLIFQQVKKGIYDSEMNHHSQKFCGIMEFLWLCFQMAF